MAKTKTTKASAAKESGRVAGEKASVAIVPVAMPQEQTPQEPLQKLMGLRQGNLNQHDAKVP
jgi:RecA-family ATPase